MSPISIKVQELIKRGATIHNPATVDVDGSIDPDRIAPGVIVHAGCRISGKETSIGPGCILGEEAPATLENCQLAGNVALKGGFFSGAVFLSDVVCGSCSHVRPGTLLEEQASCAHAVGLKQTMLMPYVTLGSLVNFCDCLMAGGTDRRDHSEVGSSYIHFNYTPNQDKATASLIGDVPRGVMLDQRPIFLGGQGGLVGPCRIEYGTVVAAGTICRKDVDKQDTLVFGSASSSLTQRGHSFVQGIYSDINRILTNNFVYLGNLHALLQWYLDVRSKFMSNDCYSKACHAGAMRQIHSMIDERVKRLSELAEKMPSSIEIVKHRGAGKSGKLCSQQRKFMERWPELASKLSQKTEQKAVSRDKDLFMAEIENVRRGATYLETIASLGPRAGVAGTAWLQSIVDSVAALW
jgi:bifunctional UDP-N-acetylglucosamine pyrophosphorylase / glucosamine-1-phosphate N-acetyltransferase